MGWQTIVCAVATVIVSLPAATATASPQQRSKPAVTSMTVPLPGAVIHLKDGTQVVAKRVRRTSSCSCLIVELEDGSRRTIDLDDVDLVASKGVPPAPRANLKPSQDRRSRAAGSLSAFARSTTLKLPDGGTELTGLTTSEPGSTTEADRAGAADGEISITSEQPPPADPAVTARLDALTAAWSAYRELADAIEGACRGHTIATLSCGKQVVVSRRKTAACRDVVSQASASLGTVEARYSEVGPALRRSGMSPGEARALLSSKGLADFERTISRARSYVQSW
jgi:hypothetical protein